MSHTGILDKVGQRLSTRPRLSHGVYNRGGGVGDLLQLWRSEDSKKSDFNCETFVDISTEMIAQFFEW